MNQNQKAEKRFREWEIYAGEDEQIIQIALKESGPPNQICLHAQQMAEKYLKGFLVYHKENPLKTHQLDKLLFECQKYSKKFSQLTEEALLLSDYYIETRYPMHMVQFSRKEAEKAYSAAKKIKKTILQNLIFNKKPPDKNT